MEEGAAAPALRRYNRLPSITISAALAEGYDLGSAIVFMEQLANETLPAEASLGFSGQSREFLETSGGVAVIFGLALPILYRIRRRHRSLAVSILSEVVVISQITGFSSGGIRANESCQQLRDAKQLRG
jgi:hypothetical protein